MSILVFPFRVLVLALVCFLAGCKLVIMVDSGGNVTSGAGQGCNGPAVCEITIVDTDYTATFTAEANPGYEFVRWQDGSAFLCPNSTERDCVVSIADTPYAGTIVASLTAGRISPIFRETEVDSDGDGTRDTEDPDDDNDGIDDEFDECRLDAPADLPNGCPDSDADGVADKDDECPALGGPVVDVFGCPGLPIGAGDIVAVDGAEWAQPDLFGGVTWDEANLNCPGGPCAPNTVINGHQVGGWNWASVDEANALINYYQGGDILGPGPDSFTHVPGTDLALPAMLADGFRVTSESQGYVMAFTSTRETSGLFRGYRGVLHPQSFSIKTYSTLPKSDTATSALWYGLWLYR